MIRRFLAMGLLAGTFCLGLPQLGQAGPWRCHSTHYYTPCCTSYYVLPCCTSCYIQPCYYRYVDCCGNVYYYPIVSTSVDGTATADSTATGNSDTATGGTEPISAEEQTWLTELSKGKTGPDLAKFEQLWKDMSHKDRKDFYDEIQKAKSDKGSDKDVTQQEAVTPEEQTWFGELSKGKAGEELAKFDQLWKDMNHKDRKDFYDEIQKAKKGG
jgi:hypothetical protein